MDAKDEETAPVLRNAVPDGIKQLDKNLVTGSGHPRLDVIEDAGACLWATATAGPMDSLHVLQEEDTRRETDNVVQEHIDQVVVWVRAVPRVPVCIGKALAGWAAYQDVGPAPGSGCAFEIFQRLLRA